MQLHIVYTETNILLSKHPYTSWREIQDEYESYKTSLGPWEHDEVIEYLADEHPNLSPSAQEQVGAFLVEASIVKTLTFCE
ncbi:hypothetical protein P2Q70_21135 [Pseudomonas mendocina]|uniref:hypothetical protein n=1 Tax=Ectopseudomonas mendocina TaxID=300 RepID=UPI0023DC3A8E|nr:hypothetical protein [Pseudomonas mendocina]MDF2077100.1 hypothetical protein [Pseudomonas mendocina]